MCYQFLVAYRARKLFYVNWDLCFLSYRLACFTGKYPTRKTHTKLYPGPECRIFSYPAFQGCLCKQSVKNDERQIGLYNKKKIARWLEDTNFTFLCQKQYTHSLRSFVKYCFYHSKIKFISPRRQVISSINF